MTFSEGTSPHVFEVAVDKLSAEARIWRENKIDLLSVGATLLKTVKMRSEITPKTTESVAKLLGPDGDLRLFHNPARNMLEGCKNPQWIEYWIKNGDIDFKKEAAQTPGLTIDLALDLCEDVAAVTTDPTVYRDVWGQIFRNDAVNSEHVIFDKMWEIASRPGNEGLKNYIRWRTELQGWKPPKESS
jgi:hypothetical protein